MVKSTIKTQLSGFMLGLLLLFSSCSIHAAVDTYQFKETDKQARFQKLTHELRCPKCQNQNLADSNAEIAGDLRAKIYLMLEQDKTDTDIINYMLERYGDFVLYQPRLSKQTLLLWYAPALLLVLGLIVIVLIVRFRKKAALNAPENAQLSQEQQQKLAQLLQTKQSSLYSK